MGDSVSSTLYHFAEKATQKATQTVHGYNIRVLSQNAPEVLPCLGRI